MSISKEISAVEQPQNTYVVAYGNTRISMQSANETDVVMTKEAYSSTIGKVVV